MLRSVDGWQSEGFAFGEAKASTDAAPMSVAVADSADGPTATIPDAHLLFNAQFSRSGPDLMLQGDDNKSAIVRDYFASDVHARLLSPEGASLSADIVDKLAGPLAPNQFAQAGAPAAAQAVGRVVQADTDATIVRNGVAVAAAAGDAVFKGDVLQTVSGKIGVTFTDGSTLNLTANTRMVVNEFVYDPKGNANSQLLDLVQGSLTFISGEIAHNGNMRIGTPVATMGIRGTVGGVTTANDGTVQFYVSQSAVGAVILDRSGNIVANVVQDGPLILVRPAGPLQIVAEEIQKTPAQLAVELAALQQILNIKSIGDQIMQQFLQQDPNNNPNPNPNPQSTDGPRTHIQLFPEQNKTGQDSDPANNGGPPVFTTAAVTTTTTNPDGTTVTHTDVVTVPHVNVAPVLNFFNLAVAEGGVRILAASDYQIVDPDSSSFVFTVANVTGGSFQVWLPGPAPVSPFGFSTFAVTDGHWANVTSFTADDIAAGHVRFVHDGGNTAPAFSISVSDYLGSSAPFIPVVTFETVNDAPALESFSLAVTEGGTTMLTTADFAVTDSDSSTFWFTVIDVTGGQFELFSGDGWAAVSNFSAADIAGGHVRFVHDGNDQAPEFSIAVNDGGASSEAISAAIDFTPTNDAPELDVWIDEGGAIVAENGELVFGLEGPRSIRVSDDDSGTISVTLTATHGIVQLDPDSINDVTIIAGGQGTSSVTLSGSPDAINSAINGMAFKPDAGYSGQASLQISGSDGHSTTSQTLPITVGDIRGDFLVSQHNVGEQEGNVVVGLEDGRFLIVWDSEDPSHYGVAARFFNSNGTAAGDEFAVGGSYSPDAVRLSGGDVAVVYVSGNLIEGRILSSDGSFVGDAFQVNSNVAGMTSSALGTPSITALANNRFLVTWTSATAANDSVPDTNIAARIFTFVDGQTQPATAEFPLNFSFANPQSHVSSATLLNGSFVVTYWDAGTNDVRAVTMTANGSDAYDFLVPSSSAGFESEPVVTALADGGFAVAWAAGEIPGVRTGGIWVRTFDENRQPVAEFQVDATDAGVRSPAIVGLPTGGYLITWTFQSAALGDSSGGVAGQWFGANGQPVGAEFRINSVTDGFQGNQDLAVLENGNVVVTWASRATEFGDPSAGNSVATILTPPFVPGHAPVAIADQATVSEEGLAFGLTDTYGTVDISDSKAASGTIAATDADGDQLTFTLGTPSAQLTSNGVSLTWTGAGTGTLTGFAGTTPVITITIDAHSGAYTVALKAPLDHADGAAEDVASFDIPVNVSDGALTTSTMLTVNVEDDSPRAADYSKSAVVGSRTTVNFVIMLDVSGSMAGSNIVLAKQALDNLLSTTALDINQVMVVAFSGSASVHLNGSNPWTDATSAKAYIQALGTNGGTNYDAALGAVMNAWGTGPSPADKTMMYFISDGEPSAGQNINSSEKVIWEAFLTSKGVDVANAIGISTGVDDVDLAPIAWAPGNADLSPIVLTSAGGLDATLQGTVPNAQVFNVLTDGGAGTGFGADGGRILSVQVGGKTFTWDGDHTITRSDGEVSTALNGTWISVTTALGGTFVFYFAAAGSHAAGDWSYTPPATLAGPSSEVFHYVLTDNDGDHAGADITVAVTPEGYAAPAEAATDHIIMSANNVYATEGGRFIAIPFDFLAYNDSPDGAQFTTAFNEDDHGFWPSEVGAGVSFNAMSGQVYYKVNDEDTGSFDDTFDYAISNDMSGDATSSAKVWLDVVASATLTGGANSEIIVGSFANETLTGNGGADAFVFAPGSGMDTITDFTSGVDKIVLLGFNPLIPTGMSAEEAMFLLHKTEETFDDWKSHWSVDAANHSVTFVLYSEGTTPADTVTIANADLDSLQFNDFIVHNVSFLT